MSLLFLPDELELSAVFGEIVVSSKPLSFLGISIVISNVVFFAYYRVLLPFVSSLLTNLRIDFPGFAVLECLGVPESL